MSDQLNHLRRHAKALRKAHAAGEAYARTRVAAVFATPPETLIHADALHVIAREHGFESWPKLKFAAESATMDRAAKAERLKLALYFGHHWVIERLLRETPDLSRENFGLTCALYDVAEVRAALAREPSLVQTEIGPRRPILHLCYSQHFKGAGSEDAMMAVAEALLGAGADVNDSYPEQPGSVHRLSALYGALGHAGNLKLAAWLLDHGADPNDGESLYHATELGHTKGLELLLAHGADIDGTNALPRALDFNDHAMVKLLLDHGANPNEGIASHPSEEPPFVIPALHQAARRQCDRAMAVLLFDAGADPNARYKGRTAYAYARIYGNASLAGEIEARGGDTRLTAEERLMAQAADGTLPDGAKVDLAALTEEDLNIVRSILHLPESLPHMQRLVAAGLPFDHPDAMGLPPVHIAGWEGLRDKMAWLLSLGPDLDHVNGYGGTLLSTIVHGSENAPRDGARDHIGCLRLALEAGVPLPRTAADFAGEEEVADFLASWAEHHPEQVVEGGPV